MHYPTSTHRRLRRGAAALLTMCLTLAGVRAATVEKADNADDLNQGSSWSGGTAPTTSDLARWSAVANASGTAALGADASWKGVIITDPATAVAILGGNTLTLGGGGIDMSLAAQDLSISSGLAIRTNTHQVWDVAAGRSLVLGTGAFTRGADATLNVRGAGTVTTTLTGLSQASLSNNIVGAWASFDAGENTTYATINATDVVTGLGYTGGADGVAVGNASELVTGAGINYKVAAGGATSGAISLNTLRYTGEAGTIQVGPVSPSTTTMTLNGLMNAGTGTLTVNGRLTAGSSAALVIHTATADIAISNTRITGGSKVVKTGAFDLKTSASHSTNWTGGLFINEGSVTAVPVAGGSPEGILYYFGNGGPVVVAEGAVLNMDGYANNGAGVSYAISSLSGAGTVNVRTGIGTSMTRLTSSLAAFSGVLNVGYKSQAEGWGGKVLLNANTGNVAAAVRINVGSRGTLMIDGGITVAAPLTLAGGDTGESLGQLRLEGDSTYSGDVTLTGNVAAGDFTIGSNSGVGTISGNIGESGGSWDLSKGGAGRVVLTGTNTYTGMTRVVVGNLQVGAEGVGSTSASSAVSVNGATAVLSGTGTLNGSTTIVQGRVRPGDTGGDGHGTLNFGNGVTFNPAASTTVAEFSIAGTSSADETGDRIHITGNLTLDAEGNFVVMADAGFVPAEGQSWILMDWSGLLTLNGWNIGLLQRDGSGDNGSNLDLPDIAASGLFWEISALQDGATGGALVLSIAPEPGRMVLLGLGVVCMTLRRRRGLAAFTSIL